jgi:hypothetical protein
MITRPESVRLRRVGRLAVAAGKRSIASDWAGRLIRIVLTLYLIPALLAVLVVGISGMLVLAVGNLCIGLVQRPVR